MCGIVAIFNIESQSEALRKQALKMSKRIRHRGPDWSGIYAEEHAILAHERLSIVDPQSGGQPLKTRREISSFVLTARFTITGKSGRRLKTNMNFRQVPIVR